MPHIRCPSSQLAADLINPDSPVSPDKFLYQQKTLTHAVKIALGHDDIVVFPRAIIGGLLPDHINILPESITPVII
jgi:hypothetical protein